MHHSSALPSRKLGLGHDLSHLNVAHFDSLRSPDAICNLISASLRKLVLVELILSSH